MIGFVGISTAIAQLRWPVLLAAILALGVVIPVFTIWGGLVPPGQEQVEHGITLGHGALGFAYAAVFVVVLAPRFFLAGWRWSAAIGIAVALAVTAMGGLQLQIAAGVARHLPGWAATIFQFAGSIVLVGGGVALVLSIAINIWHRRDDRVFVLAALLTLGLAATPAFVAHQFSSRYLITILPFALIAVQPYFRPSYWAAARLAAGATVGALSLGAYFGT